MTKTLGPDWLAVVSKYDDQLLTEEKRIFLYPEWFLGIGARLCISLILLSMVDAMFHRGASEKWPFMLPVMLCQCLYLIRLSIFICNLLVHFNVIILFIFDSLSQSCRFFSNFYVSGYKDPGVSMS